MCRVINLLLLCIAVPAAAAELPTAEASDRVLRASCRIFANNARGSGVIFDSDADTYRVLTNAHVVGQTGNRVEL